MTAMSTSSTPRVLSSLKTFVQNVASLVDGFVSLSITPLQRKAGALGFPQSARVCLENAVNALAVSSPGLACTWRLYRLVVINRKKVDLL